MSHNGQPNFFLFFHDFGYATSLLANILSLVSAWVKSDHDATFAGRVVSRGKMLS
jgi:hypothetical protein